MTPIPLHEASLMQCLYGKAAGLSRLFGAIDDGNGARRWIVTGFITSMSADRRSATSSSVPYEVVDYRRRLTVAARELAVWHLWRRARSLPDEIVWLRSDGSRYGRWTLRKLIEVIRAETADRERLRRMINDARDGDGLDVT